MVRELMHDPMFLAMRSAEATADDLSIGSDLMETLLAHKEDCVGMAANMIGFNKRIIAVADGKNYLLMYNPVILKASDAYETEEGCLSLLGGPRKTRRYRSIKVQYQTEDMKPRIKTFKDFTAQIIQHEIDHCDGILI